MPMPIGRNFGAPVNTTGFTAVNGVTSTEMKVWGIGIAQNISAAATDLYLGYRHFDADIKCADAVAAATCSGGVQVGAPHVINRLQTEGIDVIVAGARVLF